MNCPSCNTPLEPTARFCGVCGYRLQAKPAPAAGSAPLPRPDSHAGSGPGGSSPGSPAIKPRTPPAGAPLVAKGSALPHPNAAGTPPKQAPRASPKPRKVSDDIYINQVLNNRFKVESKIGEGGFGAVYRGVQLATGRKVALKLLHPEMTKDENLVARFRREGMVLCNLRDAHTITTYDFDQTPDGTLYIAMELLEGKSLHQLFHEQAPLDWKRVFKILSEMCSSLSEAHTQGIVHRDLKPENVYLESRPGNPEFVKILDFGIAKVMRGDTIDPQSPQLTATGQTLGTLEYMSPEQLMGKPLDGRSDVYALGVVAYEMITGRLPFPDAKGPAGLITAQLKQTPAPPSQANAKAAIPPAADRVILKSLEKDKNNRYADVSQLAAAIQEVLAQASSEHAVLNQSGIGQRPPASAAPDLLETRRGAGGEPPSHSPPMMPAGPEPRPMAPPPQQQHLASQQAPPHLTPPAPAYPQMPQGMQGSGPNHHAAMPPPSMFGPSMSGLAPSHHAQPTPIPNTYGGGMHYHPQSIEAPRGSTKWVWWVIALLALGAAVGAVLAVALS